MGLLGDVHMNKILLLLAAISFLQSCQRTQTLYEKPHFVLDNYGRIDSAKGNEKTFITEDTITGRLMNYEGIYPFIVDREEKIKGEFGTDIGIEFSVSNFDKIHDKTIKVVIIHPLMINPDTGKSSTVDSFYSEIEGEKHNQIGWVFNHDWENVKGLWKFQIYYQEEMVIEKSMITY